MVIYGIDKRTQDGPRIINYAPGGHLNARPRMADIQQAFNYLQKFYNDYSHIIKPIAIHGAKYIAHAAGLMAAHEEPTINVATETAVLYDVIRCMKLAHSYEKYQF